MANIADLAVKIGADASSFYNEMKKTKSSIHDTFDTKPVKGFHGALDELNISMSSVVGTIGKWSAIVGVDLHIASSIKHAVEASRRLNELSATLGTSEAEASRFSKTIQLAGGDVQTASTSIMRLDKTITSAGTSSDKARQVLDIFGVSLTDANGKLLPVTEQMKNLAQGFKLAQDAGFGQEYLMETLGARGLSLAGALNEYADAADKASQIKGIGLDTEQLREVGLEIDAVKMQMGQFSTLVGASLAPVAAEYLPPILSGLSDLAQYISKNKEEVNGLVTSAVEFFAVYKAISLATAAKKGFSLVFQSGTNEVAKEIAQQEELTRVQERNIAKREQMLEKAALNDSKRKYEEIQRMQVSEAEKTRIYTQYCVARESQAVREAAAIRAAMTQTYTSINAQAVASSAVQTNALAKVTGAAAVTGVGMSAIGTNAVAAGVQTANAMGKMSSVVASMGKLVWGLVGGWVGVATAIGFAIYKLHQFYQAERTKAANDPYVEVGGKKYQYDKDDNVMVRLKDNGTRMNIYDQGEMDTAKAAYWEKYGDPTAKENESFSDQYKQALEAQRQGTESIQKQMAELMASFQAPETGAGGSGASGGRSASAPAVEVPKTQSVQIPIGQVMADDAAKHVGEYLGTEMCAAFVSEVAQEAGVSGLNSAWAPNLVAAATSRGAYEETNDPYAAKAGDIYVWGDADHVGIADGNGGHYASNGTRTEDHGVTHGDVDATRSWYGNLTGIIHMDKFTGNQMGSAEMTDAEREAQEKLNKLNEAKDKAVSMYSQMSSEILQQTGTAWGTGMDKIIQDVQSKQIEINKIREAGVPEAAIKKLEDKLAEYQKVLTDQVEKKRQEALDKTVSATKKANAELQGNYKALADVEYETTLQELQKEREEKEKEVAKNKSDKESMAAVEDWYTSQVQAAAEKRTEAYRDSFEKQVKYSIQHHDLRGLTSLMQSSDGKDFIDWASQSDGMEKFYSEWRQLQSDMHESMLSQVADVASSTEGAFKDFFNNLVEGKETFGDAFSDLVDTIMESVVQQITDKWAAQITSSIFGGILGNQNGSGGDLGSNMVSGGLGTLFNAGIGSLFGGGNDNSSGGIGDYSGFMPSIMQWTKGINDANTATGLLTGTTSGLNKITGTYNTVQTMLATATKPAEQTTTMATTGALGKLTLAAYSASIALKTISFGGIHHAAGGPIVGPGTGTSDSIPAFLSNGEFVINAAAVSRVGMPLLEAINNGRFPHFSAGGAVSAVKNVVSGISVHPASNVVLNVSALDASSFADFLRNGGATTIKQMLLDTDRDFTGAAEVW